MKIFREYIIVKVPSVFIDETPYKGVNGMNIMVNVFFNPERHVRSYGIVTSVPDDLCAFPIASDHHSAPAYVDYPPFSWKTTEDVELDIKLGDKAYFHPNCLLPDENGGTLYNQFHIKSQKENGVWMHYFMVKYELVYATVRYEPINNTTTPFDWKMEPELKPFVNAHDGEKMEKRYFITDKQGMDHIYRKQVTMIGSYVFIEPDMETWDDISIPTPMVVDGKILLGTDGKPKMKPKDQWLVTKSVPTEKYLRGWVRYTGSPLKGDQEFLKPGMYVYFQRFANTHLKFEGLLYFRMRQRHVFGRAPYNQLQNATV